MSNRIHEGAIRDGIAAHSNDSKKQLRDFSNALFDILRNNLLADGHIRLHQFGSFKLKWTKERTGKNPQTGETIIIPAHPRITFTAAKALKDRVSADEADSIKSQSVVKESVAKTIHINSVKKDTAINVEHKKTTINPEPYLRKNIHPKLETEKKQTAPVSFAAAALLLLVAIYFIGIDTDTVETLHSEQINTVAASSNITAPTETGLVSSHISNPPVTEIKTTQKILPTADLSNETTIIKNEPHTFFKQRPHKLADGDSLWRLSKKNYINPFFWPHIYQANKYKIHNPNKLLIGRSITLPTLLGNPENLNAEDKRNIAEGYFLVYLYHKKTNKPFPYYALLGAEKFDPEVIKEHAYDIDEEDWNNLQIASN